MVHIEELRLAPENSLELNERAIRRKDNEGFVYQAYCGYLPARNEQELITKINIIIFINRQNCELMMEVYAKSLQLMPLGNRKRLVWKNILANKVCKTLIASESVLAEQLKELGYDIDKVTLLK